MELFCDGSNSPRHLTDVFQFRCNSNQKQKLEETIYNTFAGSTFFQDPQFTKSKMADFSKEDFIVDINSQNQQEIQNYQVFDITHKIQKSKKKKDLKKNICGYITKRIIREFLSDKYRGFIWKLCVENKCKKSVLRPYLLSKIQSQTGPLHLEALFNPSEDKEEMAIKKIFLKFFEWFLKERYVRYLIEMGKMNDKSLYIEYKNTTLARVVRVAKGRHEQWGRH